MLSAVAAVICAAPLAAQIKIGEIEINGLKRPKVKKTPPNPENPEPEPKPENQPATTGDGPPEWFLNVMLSDVAKAKEEVDTYTAADKMYLVSSPSAPWLLRAVSLKARIAFAVDKKFNDWRLADPGNKYDTALDGLAASAARKLPGYLPAAKNFQYRDAALETAMKSKLKNAATLKLFKTGLFHASWIIEKDDSGFPKSRYREAYVWAKDSTDDHRYCHLYGFVVQQDYAGGGSYGATYVYPNTDALFGCPAN